MDKDVYCVTVAIYAHMLVEAENPQEAMEIAGKYKDEYLTEEDFEDSDIEIDSCETYPCSLDDYEDDENVYTRNEVNQVSDYLEC